ncbi:biotin--[acetyl-CoA-carboxylase] ligase [Lacihabitans soyangensis]|uniref:biotin--[acetyl-CoA-carboxylase] ligase n=1 Tax=Lacihabitans soyangensis TaxID=869394 RepID=UPI0020CDED3F|nr:biotin--[acetyl-CoA-carboxylase] ligase [Lacihabitans soyangensis]
MLKIQPKTFFVGKNLIFLPSCHSTNDIANEIIQNKEFIDGTVILTDHQTAGRGQRGNAWESNIGQNILMSLIVKTTFLSLEKSFDLSITVAVSVLEALQTLGIQNTSIKWPNDLYINEKKTGGILIENSISGNKMSHSIVGIGINVNQTKFENIRATSLCLELKQEQVSREIIVEKICESIESNLELLKSGSFKKIKEKYLLNLFGKDQLRVFKSEKGIFEGEIVGISDQGHLKIISQNEEKYYNIKEIEYLFDD